MKLSVRSKLLANAGILILLLATVVGAALFGLNAIGTSANDLDTHAIQPFTDLGRAAPKVQEMRVLFARLMLTTGDAQKPIVGEIQAADQFSDEHMAKVVQGLDTDEEKALYADYQTELLAYRQARDEVIPIALAGRQQEANALALKNATPHMTKFSADVAALYDILAQRSANELAGIRSSISTTQFVAIVFLAIAILVGFVLSFVIARGIRNGVADVRTHMTAMAAGAERFAECLSALARNDLTQVFDVRVEPIAKYGSDEIGQAAVVSNQLLESFSTMVYAYATARDGLAQTIGDVQSAAEAVSRTSAEVNGAATQSGAASSQIAATIGQVAAGAADQARAAGQTSVAVGELSAVIEQVGAGAAETTRKIEAASVALADMSGAIGAVSTATGELDGAAMAVKGAAEHGTTVVAETAAGMDRIKDAVEGAASRVTELGAKSDQIGAIVETIDDIAEQTNLLALNAAIEAARAGEMGKGFAVVADEVRKLAERSGRATKEIAALIAEVQAETRAAVAAMETGASEVGAGAELASQARQSLSEITRSVGQANASVVRIAAAVDSMTAASGRVVAASDEIGVIAGQTNAAARRMTASAHQVSESVGSIAAISQENSAAAEEVSAATEEMSAQAEEAVASAAALAEMARGLDELVARFTLDGASGSRSTVGSGSGSGPGDLVQRRRVSDWGGSAEAPNRAVNAA